jgi:hypothetical protein
MASHGDAKSLSAQDRQMFDDICGDLDIRIGMDGTWFYHGTPIGRKALVKLFSTVLQRDANGDYWLVTPAEKGRIEVEDAPFVAVELIVEGAGPKQVLKLRTNVDDIVAVDSDHPLRVTHDSESGEPRPYVLVRDGLEARLNRPVFYELVALGEERREDGDTRMTVRSAGEMFDLGSLEADGA